MPRAQRIAGHEDEGRYVAGSGGVVRGGRWAMRSWAPPSKAVAVSARARTGLCGHGRCLPGGRSAAHGAGCAWPSTRDRGARVRTPSGPAHQLVRHPGRAVALPLLFPARAAPYAGPTRGRALGGPVPPRRLRRYMGIARVRSRCPHGSVYWIGSKPRRARGAPHDRPNRSQHARIEASALGKAALRPAVRGGLRRPGARALARPPRCLRRPRRPGAPGRGHRLAQPRTARGRPHHRGAAPGARGRRLGQDARAHLPHRPHGRRPRRAPVANPRHHLYQQGCGRDARASGRPVARWYARHVGVHLPRHVRAHAPRGRRPSGLHGAVHHL